MKVAIIGMGNMGASLASALAGAGYEISIGAYDFGAAEEAYPVGKKFVQHSACRYFQPN
ncbi:MAG: NAD(P)-binding domain-containing protein [Phycisphaerales bacterium]|nr:NAD(P)-binding domain-containing protein [Phycisphaerales bacterium]